jgi:hypothetical protein
MAGLWNIGFYFCLSVPLSLRKSASRYSLFLLLRPGSNPFQSYASFSLGFFYLIVQFIRPLIYTADTASRFKHPARSVDSAIVHQTGVKPTITITVSLDGSGQIHTHAWTVIKQTFSTSKSSTASRGTLLTRLSNPGICDS